MKNTIFLLMFLLPVIACQNNNPNITISASPSSIKSSGSVLPTISSTPSNTPMPSIVITPSPSPIIPDPAKLDYPNDFNQMSYNQPKPILPTLPDNVLTNTKKQITRGGCVFDRYSNRIPNADITIKSLDTDNEFSFLKNLITDQNGCFTFTVPDYIRIQLNIFATKIGFTTRVRYAIPDQINYDGPYSFGKLNEDPSDIYTNRILTINNEPEITSIIINAQEVRRFDYYKYVNSPEFKLYDNAYLQPNLVNKNTELSRFKLKNAENIKITLKFNKPVNKDSVEKNIKIESLDKKEIYNYVNPKARFEWKDSTSVIFSVPVNQNITDTKYRIGFEQAFLDYQGNKAFTGMYIALQPDDSDSYRTELSENIVFTLAGNK